MLPIRIAVRGPRGRADPLPGKTSPVVVLDDAFPVLISLHFCRGIDRELVGSELCNEEFFFAPRIGLGIRYIRVQELANGVTHESEQAVQYSVPGDVEETYVVMRTEQLDHYMPHLYSKVSGRVRVAEIVAAAAKSAGPDNWYTNYFDFANDTPPVETCTVPPYWTSRGSTPASASYSQISRNP